MYHNYKYGIVVYNTDIRFVQEAANLLGGANVRKCGSAKSTNLWKNPKQMYQVQIARHEKVLKILKLIRPYLIIKKDKADELIKFIESHNWRKSYHPEMARQ